MILSISLSKLAFVIRAIIAQRGGFDKIKPIGVEFAAMSKESKLPLITKVAALVTLGGAAVVTAACGEGEKSGEVVNP